MINKIINRNLGKMAKEILSADDAEVKSFIKEMNKERVDEMNQIEFMKTILSQVLIADEEDYEEALYEYMDDFLQTFKMHSESYSFSVELNHSVIHSTRRFRLPAYLMVSDLCYAVLAAYQSMGSHLFVLDYKNERFCLDREHDADMIPADLVPLGKLEMRKGNTLKLVYDFGENWEFVIRYDGKKKVDYIENVPKLLSGEGYNIWEDEKDLLEKLILNPKEIITENVTVLECAEAEQIDVFKEEQKESFVDDIFELKDSYEAIDFADLMEDMQDSYSGEYQA